MRKLILALVALALVAVPAFAGVQNVKVSGTVSSVWLLRENFDLGFNTTGDAYQNVFFTQMLLGVDADLTDQVSASLRLINERPWSDNSNADITDIDLNLAYVTLREMLYSPLTVVVGRQVWSYGNSFIFNATGTNNTAPADSGLTSVAQDFTNETALDAIRLIFDYNPLTIETFYSKVDENTLTSDRGNDDDVDLTGIDATYELGDNWNTLVEGYFFSRLSRSARVPATGGTGKTDTIHLPGFRVSTNPIEGLNTQLELAWQRGTRAVATNNNQQRRAMAAEFIAGYQLPVWEEYKPFAQYVYTFVSGDSEPNNVNSTSPARASREVYEAWDPFFEAQGSGKIYNTIFDLTNAHIHTLSLQATPLEDLTAKFTWTGMWLHHEVSGATNSTTIPMRQPDGSAVVNAAATRDKGVGHEYDIDLTYAYTEDVAIGASFGWFNPGDAFAAGNDSQASQAIVSVGLNF